MEKEKIISAFDRCCHAIPCNECDWDACHKFKLPPPRMHIPLDLCLAVLTLLKEQEAEISFLKGMQLKTIHNMSEGDIGDAVAELLRLKGM